MRSPCRITVLRHEFIQRYRIAANPFEHTHARRDPQESGELLRRGLAAMVTHRTDRRDADLRGATQMLSRTCELFVPNAEASARLAELPPARRTPGVWGQRSSSDRVCRVSNVIGLCIPIRE
jgi:hypothetical protein